MSRFILFFDTETSGLPVWHEPSGGDNQPHLVQLAARFVDADTRKVLQTLDVCIAPDGWDVPQEVVDIHGLDAEHLGAIGVPEGEALSAFMHLWAKADVRVGHSERFDARIIRIALKRYVSDWAADEWKAGAAECTGLLARPAFGLKGCRIPKLTDTYEHFVGEPLEDAHSALADTDACLAIYFAMQDEEEVA